jgi:hypothetical protein
LQKYGWRLYSYLLSQTRSYNGVDAACVGEEFICVMPVMMMSVV